MADFDFIIDVDIERLMSGKPIDLGKAVDRGIKSGLRDCAMRIRAVLMDNLTSYGLEHFISQIHIVESKDGIVVEIREGKEYYAMYVEYGTGIVGESSPHPDPSRHGWHYDINDHGDTGWWYPTDADDPNPTKYRSKMGWWAWTAGQAARPFMYETWLWARRSFNNIITAHINKEIKKEMNKLKRG